MKVALVSFVFLCSLFGFAQVQDNKQNLTPPLAIEKAFQKEFPKIKPTWSKEYRGEDRSELNYDADFTLNNINMTAVYTEQGVFKVLETQIKIADIPISINRYLKKNYPKNKIVEAAKVMNNSNKITYEIGIEINGKLSDAIFNKQGDFLEMVKINN